MAEAASSHQRLANEGALKRFVAAVLTKLGVAASDAGTVADVLVAADLRGIESHGVARLESHYAGRLRSGVMNATAAIETVRETSTSILLDAGNGLGHPAGVRAMNAVMDKADAEGAAFGAVRNSNHFGIAGYYAMLALERDMIGIASTNSVRFGAPTFGRDILLGTNPLAFAIPARDEPAFVLDFATTTVPRGKIDVYARNEMPLEPGWAVDADGRETTDPQTALRGALLPLGGFGVESGGHKGFGMGLLVDILCGVFAGGAFGAAAPLPSDGPQPGHVSHFFAAFKIDGFRDPAAFRTDMDAELRAFKDARKASGAERIYVAGEIEDETTRERRARGIPVHADVWDGLERLARELGIAFELA